MSPLEAAQAEVARLRLLKTLEGKAINAQLLWKGPGLSDEMLEFRIADMESSPTFKGACPKEWAAERARYQAELDRRRIANIHTTITDLQSRLDALEAAASKTISLTMSEDVSWDDGSGQGVGVAKDAPKTVTQAFRVDRDGKEHPIEIVPGSLWTSPDKRDSIIFKTVPVDYAPATVSESGAAVSRSALEANAVKGPKLSDFAFKAERLSPGCDWETIRTGDRIVCKSDGDRVVCDSSRKTVEAARQSVGVSLDDLTPGLAPIPSLDDLPDPSKHEGSPIVFVKGRLFTLSNGKWVRSLQTVEPTMMKDDTANDTLFDRWVKAIEALRGVSK